MVDFLLLRILLLVAWAGGGGLAAPMQADFADCNPRPEFTILEGGPHLRPNCCTLTKLMRQPEPEYKTWKQYLEQNPLPAKPRVRPAAHLIAENETYIRQLDRAFQIMKALPSSDPRSLFQQMNFHCVYGPGVVHQPGRPDLAYGIHGNWFFLPFHRWYTFFFERILARLVGDDTFALPFWNWDNQSPHFTHLPHTLPKFFRNPTEYPGLYSPYRDARHRPEVTPTVVNLIKDSVRTGFASSTPLDAARLRFNNNAHLRSLIVDGTAEGDIGRFMSYPVRAGQGQSDETYQLWLTTFEAQAHTAVHFWMGDRTRSFADMGVAYHAVRDPTFFAHHANVDRLWNVWLGLEGRHNYDDPDFLNAFFYFYDENGDVVKVTVSECLDYKQLKYEFQDVENPWLNFDAAVESPELYLDVPSPHNETLT